MKYILVTGAYGGMGRKTVEALVEDGYTVFALDIVTGDTTPNVIPVKADIANEESVKKAFDTVHETTEELFAIVHFAGKYMMDSLVEITPESFDEIFRINLRGAFLVNRTFLPMLKEGSRILITTSELAPLDPLPFTGIYGITKSALEKYAYSLAMELQLLKIRVSVLRAGAVDTGMLGASTRALDNFCEKTKLYSCNSKRFRKIVNSVEARHIPAEKIASKVKHILKQKNGRFVYSINRNPLLLLLNALPKRIQLFVIKVILK